MKKSTIDNLKLGIFVIAGILFLIIMLYMIGKDQNLFSSNIILKARFQHASGLVPGNNVRYSGIQVGTVKRVRLVNDTTIEVTMLIEQKLKTHIRKNAVASISTEGFIGNKIVNILPGRGEAPSIEDGDIITVKKPVDTEDMLEKLAVSNQNIAFISENLKETIRRVNSSTAFWNLLSDETLPANLRSAAVNIKNATAKAGGMVNDINGLVTDVKNGEGSLGAILTDTMYARDLEEALHKIQQVGDNANTLAANLDSIITDLNKEISGGSGVVTTLLKDTSVVIKLNNSLSNIEKGTDAFNENMEALKHNILFRGYFKRLEKQRQKAAEKNRPLTSAD